MSQENIKSKGIWIAVLGIGAFFVFVQAVTLVVFHIFNKPRPVSALEAAFQKTVEKTPQGPLLQESNSEDLTRLRKYEDEILNSYAWVDRSKGMIRIPIERAMDLMVAKK